MRTRPLSLRFPLVLHMCMMIGGVRLSTLQCIDRAIPLSDNPCVCVVIKECMGGLCIPEVLMYTGVRVNMTASSVRVIAEW